MDYYKGLIDRCALLGRTEYIGSTVGGFPIPVVHTGEGASTLIVASVHAREHITTELVFGLFGGTKYPFDIVPCLNIDGVILAREGLGGFPDRREFLLETNRGKKDFSLWKANLNAVDINVNFDALWGTGKNNVRFPAPSDYIGVRPESEPETRAVADLIRRKKYSQVVCYHSKGEVIYRGFNGISRHEREAEKYAQSIGYELTEAYGSAGGLKDWYDLSFDGLGLTVEIGKDKFGHPYPESELPELIKTHERSVRILYENGEGIARRLYGGSP